MASTAILAIRIISDATKASRELQGLSDKTGKWQARTQRASAAANKIGLGLAAAGTAAFKYASDLQQSTGAVESVFKKHADVVKRTAKGAASSVGLSRSEYQEFAAVLGAQLGNMGVASDKLAGKSDKLIRTGADLAATFGGTTKDAVEALGSALRGETDPIERYGISIKEADIKAQLAAKGQDKLKGAAAKSAKAQAVLALIAKQGGAAQGAFAREANTAAGQQQRATAAMKDAAATIGTALLPIVAALAEKLASVARWVQQNTTIVGVFVAALVAFVVVAKVASAAMTVYNAVQALHAVNAKRAAAGQRLLNLSMLANPIVLVIAAIVALVAVFVLAWKRSATFRRIVTGSWNAIKAATAKVWGWIKSFLGATVRTIVGWFRNWTIVGLIVKHWDAIKRATANVWNRVKAIVSQTWAAIGPAVRRGVDAVMRLVRGFYSRVTAPFRNAGTWLLEAGKAIIRGLIDGVQRMVKPLTDKLKYVTNLVPKFKGPIGKDRRLLQPAGVALMDGLIAGIQARENRLRSALRGVTAQLEAGVNPDPFARLATAGAPVTRSATRVTSGGDVFYIDARGALDGDQLAKRVTAEIGRAKRRRGVRS